MTPYWVATKTRLLPSPAWVRTSGRKATCLPRSSPFQPGQRRSGQARDALRVHDQADLAIGRDAVDGRALALAVASVADVDGAALNIDRHAVQRARRGGEGGRVGERGRLALAVDAPDAPAVGDEQE